MSGICEIFPEDPSCAVEEPVEEVVVDEGAGEADAEGEGEMAEDDAEGEEMKGEEMDGEMDGKKDRSPKDANGWIKKQGANAELLGFTTRDPMMANISYLMTAGGSAFYLLADQFLWHEEDGYKAGELKSGDTNWWKLAHTIEHYSAMGIMTIAFCTQALATFGIAVPINMMVWGYGVGMALPLIELVTTFILYYAYDLTY